MDRSGNTHPAHQLVSSSDNVPTFQSPPQSLEDDWANVDKLMAMGPDLSLAGRVYTPPVIPPSRLAAGAGSTAGVTGVGMHASKAGPQGSGQGGRVNGSGAAHAPQVG